MAAQAVDIDMGYWFLAGGMPGTPFEAPFAKGALEAGKAGLALANMIRRGASGFDTSWDARNFVSAGNEALGSMGTVIPGFTEARKQLSNMAKARKYNEAPIPFLTETVKPQEWLGFKRASRSSEAEARALPGPHKTVLPDILGIVEQTKSESKPASGGLDIAALLGKRVKKITI
jgi:hypothetical protein